MMQRSSPRLSLNDSNSVTLLNYEKEKCVYLKMNTTIYVYVYIRMYINA